MNYDPNKTYQFTDENGNVITSKGDNGYIWQAVKEGTGIFVDADGNWHTEPYLEQTQTGLVGHFPNWFKSTPEYARWSTEFAPQIATMPVTQSNVDTMKDILAQLGKNGAARISTIREAELNGITDPTLQNDYMNYISEFVAEGRDKNYKANLDGLWGMKGVSASDVAADYANLSKEELSSTITNLYNKATAPTKAGWTGSYDEQKEAMDAMVTLKLLNWVDDNWALYGDGKQFDGLLQASEWQKIQRGAATAFASITENSIVGVPARLAVGFSNLATTGTFDMAIENNFNEKLSTDPFLGANLEGLDTSEYIGMWGGAIGNVAVAFGTTALAGNFINAHPSLSGAGSFLGKLEGLGAGGTLLKDFFINDLPLDIVMYINDVARTGDFGKAFIDTSESQPLTGLPWGKIDEKGRLVPSGFGPDVPSGLLFNMIGDLIVDAAPAVIEVTGRTISSDLDGLTNGGVTRLRENIAVKNLAIQNKLSSTPVLGTAWEKFTGRFMDSMDRQRMIEARKGAVAGGSMDLYVRMQNAITEVNLKGMPTVAPMVKDLDNRLGFSDAKKSIIDKAREYGGVGETKITYPDVVDGKQINVTKVSYDDLPVQVKQGLLDIERLSELKGEVENEGGVVSNPKRDREIADLEQKVEKLPQEIKDFATKVSDMNKGLEKIRVKLGLTTQEWADAMNLDPRWEKYMTRQSLVRDTVSGGAVDATRAAQLTRGRKGYYASNYIDPTKALALKVEALGKAYAQNELKKVITAAEKVQGNVIAGGRAIEVADKVKELTEKINRGNAFRDTISYDKVINGWNADVSATTTTFNKINDILQGPEKLSLKSVYNAAQNPALKEFVSDFSHGKVTFAEGVKGDLPDTAAASVVENTYLINGKDHAGVTSDRVPYRYTVEKNKITSMTKVTDNDGIAESINNLGGIYRTDAATIGKIGAQNAYAVNRGILFYRDNMPQLPYGPTYKAEWPARNRNSVYGWIPGAGDFSEYRYRIEGGHIVSESPVYMGLGFYSKGKEAYLAQSLADDVRQRFHPKNSNAAENVPIHETGHNTMHRLAVLEVNRKIDAGEIKVTDSTSSFELSRIMKQEYESLHERFAKNALDRIGVKYNGNNWKARWREQADLISHYASTTKNNAYKHETFSEALVDYWANKNNAQPFALACVEEMKKLSEQYSMSATPRESFEGNGLSQPKGRPIFKDDQYNFPSNVKTPAQKAKWLDEVRQNNPYLKGAFTEDTYAKANMWDTFFETEARAYNPNSKTKAPDLLVKKNGDFLEWYADNSAKIMIDELKQKGIEDFSTELSTMLFSTNTTDIIEALDSFIIQKVNKMAEQIAAKMPGGAIEENINKARVTLWSEQSVKADATRLLENLVPSAGAQAVTEKITTLFREQSQGLAAYEALPVDMKNLIQEKRNLEAQIRTENKQTLREGKVADLEAQKAGWGRDVTQVVSYMENGQEVFVVVSDPVIASLYKNPVDYKNNGVIPESLVQSANLIARMYRLGTTGANPLAVVRNVLRDPMQATVTSRYFNPLEMNLNPQSFYHTLRGFGLDDATISAVDTKLRNWAAGSSLTSQLRDIGVDLADARSVSTTGQKFQRAVRKFGESKIINAAEAPLEAWESMFRNQVAQQAFTKNYKFTGDVNKALGAAMFDASNATTNFSHAIGRFRRATQTVPYLSSAINGTASFWRMFNIDPVGMIGRITSGFMVPAMAITAWNISNDERKQAYMNMPEWYRQSHIVLMDMDNNIIAFPIPEELQQYWGTARKLIEFTEETSPYSLSQILSQGAFGFLPADMDGFFGEDGSIDWGRGVAQLANGIMPQAATAAYEFFAEKDLFTGADLSNYTELNRWFNLGINLFGNGWKNVVNDIGSLCGASESLFVGKGTADTLARDLFGVGFDEVKNRFMNYIGSPAKVVNGKTVAATGLFKENEELQRKIAAKDAEIATSPESEKARLEEERQKLITDFTDRVANLTNKYMQLYSIAGGLEEWMKERLVRVLTLGGGSSSGTSDSYQAQEASQAYLNERSLAQQRYAAAGLPAGPSLGSLADGGSIALQAAVSRFYGAPKQAAADFQNALKSTNLKDIRNEFYDAIEKIYDAAEAQGVNPDYDLIEQIQARYLQAVDRILVPIINQYGIGILNNNDFIDEVRRYVNGMVPSNDWKQSARNAKKYLSKKDFPLATVDVKKWLTQRYASSLTDRGLSSDTEVTQQLQSIKADIDAGRSGAAKGKIQALFNGIQRADYYISQNDFILLNNYNNMVK